MSPHQHRQVGIRFLEIVANIWLFAMQNLSLLCCPIQMRKFMNDIVTFSFPFTNANGSVRVTSSTLDHATHCLELRIRHISVKTLLRDYVLVAKGERPKDQKLAVVSGALTESDSPESY